MNATLHIQKYIYLYQQLAQH